MEYKLPFNELNTKEYGQVQLTGFKDYYKNYFKNLIKTVRYTFLIIESK